MQTIPRIIYETAGLPEVEGNRVGDCKTCGAAHIEGILFADWVKDSFTNHDYLKSGSIVCRACLFCFSENHPLLMEKTGRPNVQKFRTYSHFVVNDEWFVLTKGEKAKMRELLQMNPAVAVIADSGQKHLAFRAKRGRWQFEEISLLPEPVLVEDLLRQIEPLLAIFSKKEIEFGNYSAHRIYKYGLEDWRIRENSIRQWRGSPYFNLVIFLAQKGE